MDKDAYILAEAFAFNKKLEKEGITEQIKEILLKAYINDLEQNINIKIA